MHNAKLHFPLILHKAAFYIILINRKSKKQSQFDLGNVSLLYLKLVFG